MTNINMKRDSYKKNFYKIGSYAALATLILIPIQIAIFIVWPHPTTIPEWFELFHRNWLLGLISFDLLYMISNILLILLFLALFFGLYEQSKTLSIIAITLGIVGITIYFSSTTGLEMLAVSRQYAEAITVEEKNILISAGHTFYSIYKGTAYSVYYVLSGIALILFFSTMIHNTSFRKTTAYFGLGSGVLMLIPATAGIIGMIFALTSLIPWMVFCVLVIKDFWVLSKT